jgi:hypothetical protein
MKVSQAVVCIDCDEVYQPAPQCPACSSKVAVFLARYFRPFTYEAPPCTENAAEMQTKN